MGYYRLRKILATRPGGVSGAASQAGINLNRIYNLTGKISAVSEDPPYFTPDEKARIMEVIGDGLSLTEGEVFEFYEDSDAKFFQGVHTGRPRNRR